MNIFKELSDDHKFLLSSEYDNYICLNLIVILQDLLYFDLFDYLRIIIILDDKLF